MRSASKISLESFRWSIFSAALIGTHAQNLPQDLSYVLLPRTDCRPPSKVVKYYNSSSDTKSHATKKKGKLVLGIDDLSPLTIEELENSRFSIWGI